QVEGIGGHQQPDDQVQERPREGHLDIGGQPAAGNAAEARTDHLDCYHQRVGHHHGPQQTVAELRSGLRISGNAAGIIIGRAGNKTGPELHDPLVLAKSLQLFQHRRITSAGRRAQPSGATPNSHWWNHSKNAKYSPSPSTTTTASFQRPGGTVARGPRCRRRNDTRTRPAQISKLPNSSRSAAVPLASKCASAQTFTASSSGCRVAAWIFPGSTDASTSSGTGTISNTATAWKTGGGVYSRIGARRATAKPCTVSTNPTIVTRE